MSWGNVEWDPDCDSNLADNLFAGDRGTKKKNRKKHKNNPSDSSSGEAVSDGRYVRVHHVTDTNENNALNVKAQAAHNNKRKLKAKNKNPPKKMKMDSGVTFNSACGESHRNAGNKTANGDENVDQPKCRKTKKRKRKNKMSILETSEASNGSPKQKKITQYYKENMHDVPKQILNETNVLRSNDFWKSKRNEGTSVDLNVHSNISLTKKSAAKHKNIKEKNAQNTTAAIKTKSPYKVKQLKQYLKKHFSSPIYTTPTENLANPLKEKMMKKLQASHFRYINEQLYNCKSEESKTFFQDNLSTFEVYHEGYRQQISKWPLNPLTVIINSLKKKPAKTVVADFGCGEAHLAKSLPDHKVYSFDFVATSDLVTPCDMSNTPLENESVDIVVFCLSLMGSNLSSYILEANRVLKNGGMMMIAEVESRFENIDAFIQDIKKFGFSNTWKDFSHKIFYFLYFKKVSPVKKSNKLPNIFLKPCLYKKR